MATWVTLPSSSHSLSIPISILLQTQQEVISPEP